MPANNLMRLSHFPSDIKRQRGAAMMLMLIVLVIGFVTMLVKSLSTTEISTKRHVQTSEVLAQAKDALIGYAITYGDSHNGEVHGYLPCPDKDAGNGEGSSTLSCGITNVSQLGRLPWKTLGLGPLRDGNGECLWYAVSGTYKSTTKTGLMNWDTNGQFQVYAADGTRLDSDGNQVVAVIFAPGTPDSSQDRSGSSAPICGGNYTASAYLDASTAHSINNASISSTASAISQFIQGEVDGDVNDRMIFITREDIWNAMQKRSDFNQKLKDMTKAVAECLADYGHNNDISSNHSLPWPALLSLSDYSVNTNYDDKDSYGGSTYYQGRVPYRVNTSRSVSDNDISYPYYLMYPSNGLTCPYETASPSTPLERVYPWWNNWKDHLFYAVSDEYRPRDSSTGTCTGDCVTINGNTYAAIVMFSGSALTGINRASTTTTNTARSVLANYLEGLNESSYPNYGGNNAYQTGATSSTFNDILYCIKTDLTVIECP
jgi:hypothetical protein